MARNKVQFQKGLSETEFNEAEGCEEQCHVRSLASRLILQEPVMKRMLGIAMSVAAIACGSAALAEMTNAHKVFLPQDIKWGATPPSLPAGAQSAVLYGDPSQDGMFVLRIKMPKGYRIPAHTHPKPEVVTIISGTVRLGMGTKADRGGAEILVAGSFSSMPPSAAHYVFVDEDAVVQINATGPWGIDYVDPREDPRLNIAPTEQIDSTRQRN